MFKKIEINIPFSEVLTRMPQYAKFMKDILRKKRKITEEGSRRPGSLVIQKTWTLRKRNKQNFEGDLTIENAGSRQLHYTLQNWGC